MPLAIPAQARSFAAEPPLGSMEGPGFSPPRTPPWACWGPSWACRPSCPPRCRRRGPPPRLQDTVTEASVVDGQMHYWLGSYCARGNSSHRVPTNAGLGRQRHGPWIRYWVTFAPVAGPARRHRSAGAVGHSVRA